MTEQFSNHPAGSSETPETSRSMEERLANLKGEWDKKFATLSDQTIQEQERQLTQLHLAIVNFRSRHSDYEKYALYHVLAGSSPMEALSVLDTPDGDLEEVIRSFGGEKVEPE